jgi:hypothetical protein
MKERFDLYILEKIKAELARKLGYRITGKSDCKRLSEIIFSQGIGYISESTLYRLLLHPSDRNYYKSTIDIISVFLGFNNAADLIDNFDQIKYNANFNGIVPLPGSRKTLLYYNIEGGNFDTLDLFFSSLEDCSAEVRETTALALYDAILLTGNSNAFFKKFAQTKYVRNYLLEQLHDPQFRIENYDHAYKLYLKGLKINSDISQYQDHIFGTSVLFRFYYLKKDYAAAQEIGRKFYGQFHFAGQYNDELHIFPFIRYKAYKLWYLTLVDDNSMPLFDYAYQLLDLCETLQPKLSSFDQRVLFHTVAEAMMNTDLPDTFHVKLKYIFQDNFRDIPDSIFSKHIRYSLPYFEVNGLLYHRP